MRPRFVAAVLVTAIVAAGTVVQSQKPAISEASIRGHMEFLASDAMRGRGSGTEDEWRTAVYIASHLRRWGIEPAGDDGGYIQTIETGQRPSGPPTLALGDLKLTHGKEMLVQSTGAGAASGTIVWWGSWRQIPAGSWIAVPEGQTVPDAALAGAAAVLVVETPDVRANWETAGARLPGAARGRGRAGAPAAIRIVLSRETHEALRALGDGVRATFDVPMRMGHTWNAVGRLTGSDRRLASEIILLSAHMDHLGVREPAARPGQGAQTASTAPADTTYNGADDDASGTTAVLELAQAIAMGPRPKRTIVFAWFGSEESGGLGSRHFSDNPPAPLDQFIANLQWEMIGQPDPKVPAQTLWLTGYDRSNLGAELAKHGAKLVADPHPDQQFFRRSDNFRFACRGIVAHTVSSFDPNGPHYHRPSDEIGIVNFAHMTEAIRSMHAPVLWLANASFKPDWLPDKKPGATDGCR